MKTERSRKPHLLLAGDLERDRSILASILRSAAYRVSEAEGGSSPLVLVRKEPPDLILLKLRMPVMDGVEICRRIQAVAACRDIPVLFTTAAADCEFRIQVYAAGAAGHVPAPVIRRVNVSGDLSDPVRMEKRKRGPLRGPRRKGRKTS